MTTIVATIVAVIIAAAACKIVYNIIRQRQWSISFKCIKLYDVLTWTKMCGRKSKYTSKKNHEKIVGMY